MHVSWRTNEWSQTRDGAHLLLVTFIYSFVYLFIYLYIIFFISLTFEHKTVKTAVEEGALVSQQDKPVMLSVHVSLSSFCLLSSFQSYQFFFFQSNSRVFECLIPHTCTNTVSFVTVNLYRGVKFKSSVPQQDRALLRYWNIYIKWNRLGPLLSLHITFHFYFVAFKTAQLSRPVLFLTILLGVSSGNINL